MNNLFDKTMPVGLTGNIASQAGYDIYGRYGFVGVRAKF